MSSNRHILPRSLMMEWGSLAWFGVSTELLSDRKPARCDF